MKIILKKNYSQPDLKYFQDEKSAYAAYELDLASMLGNVQYEVEILDPNSRINGRINDINGHIELEISSKFTEGEICALIEPFVRKLNYVRVIS